MTSELEKRINDLEEMIRTGSAKEEWADYENKILKKISETIKKIDEEYEFNHVINPKLKTIFQENKTEQLKELSDEEFNELGKEYAEYYTQLNQQITKKLDVIKKEIPKAITLKGNEIKELFTKGGYIFKPTIITQGTYDFLPKKKIIIVDEGKLIFEEGTILNIKSELNKNIIEVEKEGKIRFEGTKENPVIIRGEHNRSPFKLHIKSNNYIELQHIVFEKLKAYDKEGIIHVYNEKVKKKLMGATFENERIYNKQVNIQDNLFKNNKGPLIYINAQASFIKKNTFLDNENNLIYVNYLSLVSIELNKFDSNEINTGNFFDEKKINRSSIVHEEFDDPEIIKDNIFKNYFSKRRFSQILFLEDEIKGTTRKERTKYLQDEIYKNNTFKKNSIKELKIKLNYEK